jgi:hypothetical protein
LYEPCVYYVNPSASGQFVGNKEHFRLPSSSICHAIPDFLKTWTDLGGLKEEASKRGLGDNIEMKLSNLEKVDVTKAFVIATQLV